MVVKRWLAVLMAAVMVMSLSGVTAFAAEGDEYTVRFFKDGDVIDERTVAEGEALGALPEDPVKDGGYSFYGWTTEPEQYATVVSDLSAYTTVTGDSNYYAYFAKDLTVTFMVDGTVFATDTVPADPQTGESLSGIFAPDQEPDKEGSLFKGWYTRSGDLFVPNARISKDAVYYAKFEELGEVVFYVDDVVYEVQSFDRSGSYYRPVEPEPPVEEGFIFGGWYKDETFTSRVNFQAEYVRDDVAYYALMIDEEEKIGTVTFEVDGEIYEEQFFELGTGLFTVNEPVPPYEEDYVFAGWYRNEDFTTRVSFPTNVRENTTFYGRFAEVGAVTFMIGDEVYDEQTFVLDGTPYVINEPPTPEEEGSVFEGWFRDEEFKRRMSFPSQTREEVTLYGRFAQTGTVSFYVDGELYADQEFTLSGSTFTVTAPEAPVVDGYTFEGWYADEALTQRVTFPLQVRQSMDYYAKMTEAEAALSVAFLLDGRVFEEQSVPVGGRVLGNTVEVKDFAGREFDGWYLDAAYTQKAEFPITVEEDLILYGTLREMGTVYFIIDDEIYKEQTFTLSGDYYELQEPEKPSQRGRSFSGWYYDEGFTRKAEFPLQVTEGISLYGRFSNTLTGTALGTGMIAAILGLLAIAAAVIYMVLRGKKNTQTKSRKKNRVQ